MKKMLITLTIIAAMATMVFSQEQQKPSRPEGKPSFENQRGGPKGPPAMHQGDFQRGGRWPMWRGGSQDGKKNHPCQCPCHKQGKQQRHRGGR